jgi:TonB-linked SusC/RagA family outer membrane protein
MNLSRSVLAPFALSVVLASVGTRESRAQQPPQPPPTQLASRGSITGTVKEEKTGQPLGDVSVRVSGTSLGATTNTEGRYTIMNVSGGIYTVEVQRVGLAQNQKTDIRVVPGSPTTVDFVMSQNVLRLTGMVSTGLSDPTSGTHTPFVIARVTADQVPVVSTGDPLKSLAGRVAGLTIRADASPNGALSIQLRNPVSARANTQPMIIVDGVIQMQNDGTLGTSSFTGSPLDINPEDIASFEIVKGAAAAALYGQKAANGVIVIKTNRGANVPLGTTRISVTNESGFSKLGHQVEISNHHRLLVDQNNQFVDAFGLPIVGRNFVNDPNGFLDNEYGVPTYDHIGQMFGYGLTQITTGNLGQSSLSTNFSVAMDGQHEGGPLKTPVGGTERYNLRMNLDHRVGDKFSVSMGTFYNRQFLRQISQGSTIFSQMLDISPDIDLFKINPETGDYFPFPDGTGSSIANPLYFENHRDVWQKRAGIQANASAEYRPLSLVKLLAQGGYQRSDASGQGSYIVPGALTTGGGTSPGSLQETAAFDESFNGQLQASILTSYRDLTIRSYVSAFGTIQKNNDFDVQGDTLFQPQPDLDFARRYTNINQTVRNVNTQSFSGNVALDYSGKYIFEGLYRLDGSSLLPTSTRWQSNGRLSAAWSMAEEPWWPFANVPLAKLRYSVGSAGNNPNFSDRYETYLQNAGTERIFKQNMGNVDIVPEVVTEHEMGIDMNLMNKYEVELTYARQYTNGALRDDTVSSYTGFDTQVKNLGNLLGQTYEGTLSSTWINQRNLKWTSTIVADRSREKITSYPRQCAAASTNTLNRICEGFVFGAQWGSAFVHDKSNLSPKHVTTLDQFDVNDDGMVVAVGPNGSWTDQRWGSIVTIDSIPYLWGIPILRQTFDETGRPTANLAVDLGQSLPDFQFGIGNELQYGKWNLHLQFTGQKGGFLYNRTSQNLYNLQLAMGMDQAGKPAYAKKPSTYYLNGRTAATGNAGITANSNTTVVDFFQQKADYLKISELQLRYRFDKPLPGLKALGIKAGSIALSARNLYTFTGYSGYDPEAGNATTRVDTNGYPSYRTFTTSLRFTF